MKLTKLMLMAVPVLIVTACKHGAGNTDADSTKRTVFFDKTGMDTTVTPGDNFFFIRQWQLDKKHRHSGI